MSTSLSNKAKTYTQPLADRLRPNTLADFVGQQHLLAPGKPLRRAIEEDALHSMIFWGPPGSGKTTLARIIAAHTGAHFFVISAVFAGVKEIRAVMDNARQLRAEDQRASILFVDEVHRFNKAQQDAFLPFVEDGTVVFIGATTENPSFELNKALLSRARVYVLRALAAEDIRRAIDRALSVANGLADAHLDIAPTLRDRLAQAADGDVRRALNLLEAAADLAPEQNGRRVATEALIGELIAGGTRRFDKGGETFYDQISALHKSVRGSAPDAALYWLARMLDGGCEPLYIARRMVRMAAEDIGNADPRALSLALDAWDTQERLGSPEGELALAQAVLYMACAPKSNAVYTAFGAARADVERYGSLEIPLHLRNAPTELMRELGYGKAYQYPHDAPDAYIPGVRYFPEGMPERRYYEPVPRGLEERIRERLAAWRAREPKS